MTIQFPASPANNQIYFDTATGNRYKWSSVHQSWLYTANNVIGVGAGINDTQIIYQDGGGVAGSDGLTFNTSANTLTANTINAYSMRVTGNLYIGSNTVVISNNSISADMIDATVVMVAGSAIPTGDQSNAMYVVANAAFGHSNSTLTHSQAVYGAVNSAFGVINAAYTSTNASYVVANAAFGSINTVGGYANTAGSLANQAGVIANAAFGHSNVTYAAVNSAFGVINATFSQSNSEFSVINAAFGSVNTVGGYANTAGSLANQAGVIANAAFGHSNTTYGSVNSAFAVINSAYTSVNAGYVVANSAYGVANSALPKAGGTITGDLVVQGNVTLSGVTTYANTQTLLIGDSLLTLNADMPISVAPSENAGIEVGRGSSANVSLLWNEGSDKWTFTNDGTTYYQIASNTDVSTVDSRLTSAYGVSNAAYGQANTLATSANAYASVVGTSANAYSDTLLVTGRAYTNTSTSAANAYAASVGTSTNNYTSATYSTLTQLGQNWAVTNAAFGVANTALQNTTGTFAGNLYITGNTGIGTSTPQSKAEVVSYGADTTAPVWLTIRNSQNTNTNDYYVGIKLKASDYSSANETNKYAAIIASTETTGGSDGWFNKVNLNFQTKNGVGVDPTTVMKIRYDGNVGINTLSPGYKLDVNGVINTTDQFRAFGGGGDVRLNGNYSGTIATVGTVGANGFGIMTSNDPSRLWVTSGGNVGISTYNPAYKLVVSNSGAEGFEFIPTEANNVCKIQTYNRGSSSWAEFRTSANNYSWLLSNATGMVFDNTGKLGVGLSAPEAKLHIRTGVATSASAVNAQTAVLIEGTNSGYIQFRQTGDNGYFNGIIFTDNNLGGYVVHGNGANGDNLRIGGYSAIMFDVGSADSSSGISVKTNMGYFNSSGLTVSGTITETSSIASKENIEDLYDPTNLIDMLNPVMYDRIGNKKTHKEVGLIAEQVYGILPEIVELDQEGNPVGIQYSKLSIYLLKVVKDLRNQIKDLKAD